MNFDAETWRMIGIGMLQTIYMTNASLLSYVLGLPLGVILVVTEKDGIRPMPTLNRTLGFIINILRCGSVYYSINFGDAGNESTCRNKDWPKQP